MNVNQVAIKVFFVCCLLVNASSAQQIHSFSVKQCYIGLGGGQASPNGSQNTLWTIDMHCLFQNKWGLALSNRSTYTTPSNMPSDITPSYEPTANINITSFHIVRKFTTKSRYINILVEGGADIVKYETYSFTPIPPSTGWGFFSFPGPSNNYYSTPYEHQTAGVSIRCSLQFPFTRVFGTELSAIFHSYNGQTIAGGELLILLGKVNAKKSHKIYKSRIKDGDE